MGHYFAHGPGESILELGGLGLLAAPAINELVHTAPGEKRADSLEHENAEQQVMRLMQQALDLIAEGQSEPAAHMLAEALRMFKATEQAEGHSPAPTGMPVEENLHAPEGMETTASALPGFFLELMDKQAVDPRIVGAGVGALGGAAAAGMWQHQGALQDQGMADARFITPEEHQQRKYKRLAGMGVSALAGAGLGHLAPGALSSLAAEAKGAVTGAVQEAAAPTVEEIARQAQAMREGAAELRTALHQDAQGLRRDVNADLDTHREKVVASLQELMGAQNVPEAAAGVRKNLLHPPPKPPAPPKGEIRHGMWTR